MRKVCRISPAIDVSKPGRRDASSGSGSPPVVASPIPFAAPTLAGSVTLQCEEQPDWEAVTAGMPLGDIVASVA